MFKNTNFQHHRRVHKYKCWKINNVKTPLLIKIKRLKTLRISIYYRSILPVTKINRIYSVIFCSHSKQAFRADWEYGHRLRPPVRLSVRRYVCFFSALASKWLTLVSPNLTNMIILKLFGTAMIWGQMLKRSRLHRLESWRAFLFN